MAKKLKAANPAQDPSRSSVVVAAEVEVPGVLKQAGLCKSIVCQNLDVGAGVGYRFGDGSVPFALYAQYRHPLGGNFSLVGRVAVGGESIWGDAFSAEEMEQVHISATQSQASAGVGVEFAYNNIPLQAMFTVQGNSRTDLGHGVRAEGGATALLTLSAGYTLSGSGKASKASSSTKDACQDAAASFQLGTDALGKAVAKCSGSAFPVFEAMAKKIGEFKLETTNAANHNEYRVHLKQFAAGIASAATADKLTPPEAVRMMKVLARHYSGLAVNMLSFDNLAQNKVSLEAGLEALQYPYISLLKLDPADDDIRGKADKILDALLERTMLMEGGGKESYLPIVLEKLVEICTDSTWLKAHKTELLDAAKKIVDRKIRLATIKLINKSL